jgi:YfiH family protein
LENYARFCAAVGVSRDALVFTKQVHGDSVRSVGQEQAGEGLYGVSPACDGLITDAGGLPLAVFSADCVPVLLYDPVQNAVGAVHAGWRGTALGIVRQAVAAMRDAYGTDPADVWAAVGPSIGVCCFETRGDVPDALTAAWGALAAPHIRRDGPDRYHVDLKGLNAALLTSVGVAPERIDLCEDCTCCGPKRYFSHRRDGVRRGLQAAMISLSRN